MKASLLAALGEGAGGDGGRRAVERLARAVGLGAGASVEEIAGAAREPARRDAVREWGEGLAELLAADAGAAGAVARAMERYAPGSGAGWYDGDHTDFRHGVFLREVIGVQVVIQVGGAAAVPEAVAGLPPRVGGFTGRAEETAALLGALDPVGSGAGASSAVLVAAVSGLGGIGKTALAVETAYQVCERGWFPGGVLFIDLHGYDQEPVTADRAVQALLRALGVRPEHIPGTADERVGLYRSVLAARGRERGAVLVLADNASSPDQVRPLLPGGAGHRVLVTSRDRLAQLGARLVPLGQLSAEEAYGLLDRALRIADPQDTRIADDSDVVEQLAGLCGHLPLALQIAVALLAEDPEKPVTELAAELTESLDQFDDGERSVRAAFELSYRRLSDEQARLLRLLARAPGPEASDEVVAALVGAEVAPSRELKVLARAHLVERGSGRGWWRLHDLVRMFAVNLGAREEGEAARERVLDFYWSRVEAADDRLRWLPGMPVPERFEDRGRALAWLDRERAGLVAVVGWGREERFARVAMRLALRLAEYLDWRRYFDDWITVAGAGRDAAFLAGNRLGEAQAWDHLGLALRGADRAEEAIDAHTRARDLLQTAGDRRLGATVWNHLGLALRKAGRTEEAIDAHTQARDLHQAAGDSRREAAAWNNLGLALRKAGRAREAIDAHIQARDLHRAVGDRYGEAMAWNNLGTALLQASRAEEAVEAYGKSLYLRREFEHWFGEGKTLDNLARAHKVAQDPAQARTAYLQSADAYIRANALTEAAESLTHAASLTSPEPTDKPAPASPPAHKPASAQPSPPPPNAPDTAEP